MRMILPLLLCAAAADGEMRFRAQEIRRDFGVVYAVLAADVNGDGKPDIVAINPTQAVWFENPTWEKHVILDGATKKDNVCMAAADIDGDGKLDLALGADWHPSNTMSGGTLQWIGRDPAHPGAPWKLMPIAEEPTLHRIRWGDVDGDGKPELIVAPLQGRGTHGPGWEGQGARILVFHVPKDPAHDPWPMEVADDSLHILHNFLIADFDGDGQQDILTASREGVHVLTRNPNGKWTKMKIGEGAPGEIKMGHLGGKRYLATVEPWHGNSIVIYEEAQGIWPRRVIENSLAGAHAIGWGDFDGDGSDELAVGWREKKFGVAVYKRAGGGAWTKSMVDDGGMAAEDLAVADLNGDGRPDIVAVGRATANVKIYWNEFVK
jgi:aldos-2-ulose dehydratase/isomerase family protein/VCBS repeat protein